MLTYPQMPPFTSEELDAFLSEALIAKICTHNDDGNIHIAPLYFLYENGDILLGTQAVTRKVRNIQRNPNVTLLIDNPNRPFKGVIIYGKAEMETENIIEKRVSIFNKYMAPDGATWYASALAGKWQPAVIRVKPDQIISFDYSKGSLV